MGILNDSFRDELLDGDLFRLVRLGWHLRSSAFHTERWAYVFGEARGERPESAAPVRVVQVRKFPATDGSTAAMARRSSIAA